MASARVTRHFLAEVAEAMILCPLGIPHKGESDMESGLSAVGNDTGGRIPAPSRTRNKGIRNTIVFIIVMVVVMLAAMLLLPLAILYFIDPSIAETFLTYSAPYIGVSIIVIIAILVIVSVIGAMSRRRSPAQASLVQSPQFGSPLATETQDHPNQIIEIREKETVREIVKVRCHYCGTLNLETAAKCESCGANL